MWPFPRSRDPLTQPRLSTADYLCRLMEEMVALQRETLTALGKPTFRPKISPVGSPTRLRTADDVIRITRDDLLAQERQSQEQQTAPWRGNGPANGMTPESSGNSLAPNTEDSKLAASSPTPPDPNRGVPPFPRQS